MLGGQKRWRLESINRWKVVEVAQSSVQNPYGEWFKSRSELNGSSWSGSTGK